MADHLDLLARAVAVPTAWALIVNGIDDLFIDANYYLRRLGRKALYDISVDELRQGDEQRVAILVPAWNEAEVIREMLDHNLATIDYTAYDIFVGVYQNDPATRARVEEVARRARNVHCVVVPHDGPTNKADCLNWVYQGLRLAEERTGRRADILVTHDAEDVIHPLELRLFNHLVPRFDFVQTPVFPLELPLSELVAGTYLDDFTEAHLKDMLVRQAIGGLVPSAGVGSGFARDAFEDIALAHSQRAFNTGSLTEDYEIGLKFRLAGKKVCFACNAVRRTRVIERGGRRIAIEDEEWIATREYFPRTLSAAVRQRSRWILGIAMQAWDDIGWRGSLPVLYCLYRDRKALVTSYVAISSYALFLYGAVRFIAGRGTEHPWRFDDLFPPGSTIWFLVMVNSLILIWRAVMKFLVVERIYGPVQGLMSLPRFLVSNVINFAATTRALGQFLQHKITGRPLRWLKTEHAFPSKEQLRTLRRKLGELLVEREGVPQTVINEALELQEASGAKLGRILRVTGRISALQLSRAMGEQLSLDAVEPDPWAIPLSLLGRLSEEDSARLGALPLWFEGEGAGKGEETVVVAIDAPPAEEQRRELERLLAARVRYVYCPPEVLSEARRKAWPRLLFEDEHEAPRARLGELLLDEGRIDEEQLSGALTESRESGQRLGEVLVQRRLVKPATIGRLLSGRTRMPFRRVGPDEVDPDALCRIGIGPASLHDVVPLRSRQDDLLLLASSRPIHPEVRELLEERLGAAVGGEVLAPGLDLRLSLAVASRRAWPLGIAAGTSGLDGAELAAIGARVRGRHDPLALEQIRDEARRAGCSPIDHLVAAGLMGTAEAAALRDAILGIARIAEPTGLPSLGTTDGEAAAVRVVSRDETRFVLGAPRPTPRLSRRIAALMPDAAVAWRALPEQST